MLTPLRPAHRMRRRGLRALVVVALALPGFLVSATGASAAPTTCQRPNIAGAWTSLQSEPAGIPVNYTFTQSGTTIGGTADFAGIGATVSGTLTGSTLTFTVTYSNGTTARLTGTVAPTSMSGTAVLLAPPPSVNFTWSATGKAKCADDGSIQGRVVQKTTRKPIAGVTVRATGGPGGARQATTGTDGRYSLDVDAGTWTVTPRAGRSEFTPAFRTVRVRKAPARADFAGPDRFALSGVVEAVNCVSEACTSSPRAGALVRAAPVGDGSAASATSGADGTFSMEVERGVYAMSLRGLPSLPKNLRVTVLKDTGGVKLTTCAAAQASQERTGVAGGGIAVSHGLLGICSWRVSARSVDLTGHVLTGPQLRRFEAIPTGGNALLAERVSFVSPGPAVLDGGLWRVSGRANVSSFEVNEGTPGVQGSGGALTTEYLGCPGAQPTRSCELDLSPLSGLPDQIDVSRRVWVLPVTIVMTFARSAPPFVNVTAGDGVNEVDAHFARRPGTTTRKLLVPMQENGPSRVRFGDGVAIEGCPGQDTTRQCTLPRIHVDASGQPVAASATLRVRAF